jgi:hypothetical protein
MKSMIIVFGTAVLAATLAAPASAQVAGVYTGTTANGEYVTFTVSTDPTTGNLAVAGGELDVTARCKDSMYGAGDIVDGQFAFSTYANAIVASVTLDFASDGQSATGTSKTIVPTLWPVDPNPIRGLICSTGTQSLSVTLQPAGTVAIRHTTVHMIIRAGADGGTPRVVYAGTE